MRSHKLAITSVPARSHENLLEEIKQDGDRMEGRQVGCSFLMKGFPKTKAACDVSVRLISIVSV